jgi:conjugative transfer signal peptidase TraF
VKRHGLLGCGLFGIAMVAVSAVLAPVPRVVFNPSASAPRGWYVVIPAASLRVDDYALVRLPGEVAAFAAGRGYLPAGLPLLKRVGATAGQLVCHIDGKLIVDGGVAVPALLVDAQQRPLPLWTQCRWLAAGELLLLNTRHPASFDSRYFGPVDGSSVLGKAVPLWLLDGP